jgi:carbonic anhydrase
MKTIKSLAVFASSTCTNAELAAGQNSFAVIIGCADSRTSPGLLFDLFVVRLAGNILGEDGKLQIVP